MKEPTKYQVKCRLKKGDEVVVLAGKDKGEKGKISRVDRKKGRIFVENINVAIRHTKPSQSNPDGGRLEKVMSLAVSNVAFLDPKTQKPTRLGYKTVDGKKVRFAKKSGEVV